MDIRLKEECALYFPTVMADAIECEEAGPFELVIKRSNGSLWSYYGLNNTMRQLPSNSNEMTESDVRREFAIRLNRMMQLRGMSQKELSERTGVSVYSINKYLNKKVTPSLYAVDKIAKALDCSMDDFGYRR